MEILGDYSKLPLEIQKSLQARGFLFSTNVTAGIPEVSTGGDVTMIPGKPGATTYFVANVSGGETTTQVTVKDGIITA